MYGEGRPRVDLEHPVYAAHELANKGAFTAVVVLTASFLSGFGQPTTFPLGDAPPTDVSLSAARPFRLRHEVEANLRPHTCLLPCEINIHDFLLTALRKHCRSVTNFIAFYKLSLREGRGFKSRPRRNPERKLAVRTNAEVVKVKAPSSPSSWGSLTGYSRSRLDLPSPQLVFHTCLAAIKE